MQMRMQHKQACVRPPSRLLRQLAGHTKTPNVLSISSWSRLLKHPLSFLADVESDITNAGTNVTTAKQINNGNQQTSRPLWSFFRDGCLISRR